jgi:hypothetical protein
MVVVRITAHRLDRGSLSDRDSERFQRGTKFINGSVVVPVGRHELRSA